jgi:hypothetical protein
MTDVESESSTADDVVVTKAGVTDPDEIVDIEVEPLLEGDEPPVVTDSEVAADAEALELKVLMLVLESP